MHTLLKSIGNLMIRLRIADMRRTKYVASDNVDGVTCLLDAIDVDSLLFRESGHSQQLAVAVHRVQRRPNLRRQISMRTLVPRRVRPARTS